jgi:GT2 family glycosyltransferase
MTVGHPSVEPVTVVYVAHGVTTIDVSWLDPEDTVIVVHNDGLLPPGAVAHAHATDVLSEGNVGFGAGVNSALRLVSTARVILCNPDTQLTGAHRELLACGDPDQVVSVALDDDHGEPTWSVLPYPGALAAVAMGYRVGRALGRRSRLRDLGSRLLTDSGTPYASMLGARAGSWPLATHWVSAAVVSIATERLRAVGGFDSGYFLYMEDVDLCRRLAARFPSMRVRLVGSEPGRHAVGGSVGGRLRTAVERDRILSLQRYCSLQAGLRWRVASAALRPRVVWLARQAGVGR